MTCDRMCQVSTTAGNHRLTYEEGYLSHQTAGPTPHTSQDLFYHTGQVTRETVKANAHMNFLQLSK